MKRFIFIFDISAIVLMANAQISMNELLTMDLQELHKMKIVTATKTSMGLERAPSTVRVVTAKDVQQHVQL